MERRKTLLCSSLALVLGTAGMAAQAAMLTTGDLLSIDAGVPVYDSYGNFTNVSSGSYFLADTDGDHRISGVEKYAMLPGSSGGIIVGRTQGPGEIDDPVPFWSIPASHYTTSPVTGGTTYGLDMSGWTMYWNDNDVPLAAGAWAPQNCSAAGVSCSGYADGMAVFSWSGVYGDSYTLDYSARVPDGDPSGFGGVSYFLHLEGTVVSPVPIPAAAWLLTSGLLALGVARRRSCESGA